MSDLLNLALIVVIIHIERQVPKVRKFELND